MKNHFPCGHWHKRRPVVTTSTIIGLCCRYEENDYSNGGIGVVRYDVSTNSWSYEGSSLGWSLYNLPYSFRMTSTRSFLYGGVEDMPDYLNSTVRLFTFSGGIGTSQALWSWDANNTYSTSDFYNMMDVSESGLIACVCYIKKLAATDKNSWAVKVSSDFGASWTSVYYFPTMPISSVGSLGKVKIDASGNIWICLHKESTHQILIYKSSDSGITWELVTTKSLGLSAVGMDYSIDTTGQYQYVLTSTVTTGTKTLFKSSDFGVSWSDGSLLGGGDVHWQIQHVSNGSVVIVPEPSVLPSLPAYYFNVSADQGATFSQVAPPFLILIDSVSIQNDESAVVYSEQGGTFENGCNNPGFLYSLDNGSSFIATHIPASMASLHPAFDFTLRGYMTQDVDIIRSTSTSITAFDNEPMVWSMPSGQHY